MIVYAFNNAGQREDVSKELCDLAERIDKAWIVARGFNCVLNKNERIGDVVRDYEMDPYRRCVARCGLEDIKSVGCFYTWNNK